MSPEKIAEIALDLQIHLAERIGEPKPAPWRNMSLKDKADIVDDVLMLQNTSHRGLWGLTAQTGVLYALSCLLKDRQ